MVTTSNGLEENASPVEQVRESIERLRTCVMFQLEPRVAFFIIGPEGARVLSLEQREADIGRSSGPGHEDTDDDDKKRPK